MVRGDHFAFKLDGADHSVIHAVRHSRVLVNHVLVDEVKEAKT